MEITAAQLPEGTVVRFQPSILRDRRYVVRITNDRASVDITEQGNIYAIFCGYRVRPTDHNVSFGLCKYFCVNVERLEILQEA